MEEIELKHTAVRRNAEVLDFVTTTESYTIYVHPDLRLDVARCQNKRESDSNEVYLWVQAVQGFFVMHQTQASGTPGPWRVIFEISPQQFSSSFFPWADDEFFNLLPGWEELPPLPASDASEEGSSQPLENTSDGD